MAHFAPGSMPGLAGWPIALLNKFLLIVGNMISVYLFIKVAGNRPWEWFEDESTDQEMRGKGFDLLIFNHQVKCYGEIRSNNNNKKQSYLKGQIGGKFKFDYKISNSPKILRRYLLYIYNEEKKYENK